MHMQGGIGGRYGEMLMKELAVMARIPFHPNVINIYGRSEWEELWQVGIVMPYFHLGSLDNHLHKKKEGDSNRLKFDMLDKLYLYVDIVSGMEFLHSHDIIHGDVAARNVLLFRDDDKRIHAVITDFGMAIIEEKERAMGLKAEDKIYSNRGPLKWMAPEALENHTSTKMSDVYSFAITCWEILFEKPPWSKHTPQEAAKKVLEGGRPHLDILSNEKSDGEEEECRVSSLPCMASISTCSEDESAWDDLDNSYSEGESKSKPLGGTIEKKELTTFSKPRENALKRKLNQSLWEMKSNNEGSTFLTQPKPTGAKRKSLTRYQKQITKSDTILSEMLTANIPEALDHGNAQNPEDHLKIATCHIIREAWQSKAKERPTFSDLRERFKEMFDILLDSEHINEYDCFQLSPSFYDKSQMEDYQQAPRVDSYQWNSLKTLRLLQVGCTKSMHSNLSSLREIDC
jgi:serine/threonine protein kinase